MRKTSPVVTTRVIKILLEIKERHRYVELAADVMFVNKLPFIVTIS